MTRARILQEVVRLVHDDAVRQTGLTPHDVQRRQHGADVFDLLVVRQVRQVDDDAAIRIAKGAQQLTRRRRRILAAEHRDTGQRLERPVVAFRIDDAHAVAVQDQLLAEQTGHPGLARLRVAGDQHVATANRQGELASIFGVAEQQSPPSPRRERGADRSRRACG